MTTLALLIDHRRAAAAYLAGLDMEIAIAVGDRDAAQRARREMEVQTVARRATREAGCFFDMAGARDAQMVQGRAVNA
jgi:hypothetical protein